MVAPQMEAPSQIAKHKIMAGFKVERDILISIPSEELWKMVGPGFVEVYKWSSNVDHAVGKGAPEFEGAVCSERFCDVNVKGFSKISEKLSHYDAKAMNLRYDVQEGMPGFRHFGSKRLDRCSCKWSIFKAGNEG